MDILDGGRPPVGVGLRRVALVRCGAETVNLKQSSVIYTWSVVRDRWMDGYWLVAVCRYEAACSERFFFVFFN